MFLELVVCVFLSDNVRYIRLTFPQLHKKFLTLYRNWRYTAAFTTSNQS